MTLEYGTFCHRWPLSLIMILGMVDVIYQFRRLGYDPPDVIAGGSTSYTQDRLVPVPVRGPEIMAVLYTTLKLIQTRDVRDASNGLVPGTRLHQKSELF